MIHPPKGSGTKPRAIQLADGSLRNRRQSVLFNTYEPGGLGCRAEHIGEPRQARPDRRTHSCKPTPVSHELRALSRQILHADGVGGPEPTKMFAEDSAGLPQLPPSYPRPGEQSMPIGGRATNWRTMTDERAPAEWEALRDWTEWFVHRYRIPESTVPPCWYRHGQLVEELSALHCAHRTAFDRADTGNGPIGWHEHLALALPRMSKAYAGGCSNGHRDHPSRTWPDVATEEEWTAWISQSHAH